MGKGPPQTYIHLTVYDVFGYVTPGAVALLLVALFEVWVGTFANIAPGDGSPPHLPLTGALVTSFRAISDVPPGGSWLVYLLFGLLLLMAVYITGHLVASVSSFLIDRVFIYKGYGYPYRILLGVGSSDRWQKTSRAFYRGLFFWANVYLAARYLALLFEEPFYQDYNEYLRRGFSALDVLCRFLPTLILWASVPVLVAKLIISLPPARSWIREHSLRQSPQALWSAIPGKSFRKTPALIVIAIGGFFRYLFAFFYDLWSAFLGGVINTKRGFDDQAKHDYAERLQSVFGLEPTKASTNNFWLPYLYVVKSHPHLMELITNWRILYGFARNLSTAGFVAFIYMLLWLYANIEYLSIARTVEPHRYDVLLWLPAAPWFLAMMMLIRYYYLFFSYYSKFILRTFTYGDFRPVNAGRNDVPAGLA